MREKLQGREAELARVPELTEQLQQQLAKSESLRGEREAEGERRRAQLGVELEQAKKAVMVKAEELAEGRRDTEEARREASESRAALAEERRRFANLLAMRRFVRTQGAGDGGADGSGDGGDEIGSGGGPDGASRPDDRGSVGFGPVTPPRS
jgi:hypothetical protein